MDRLLGAARSEDPDAAQISRERKLQMARISIAAIHAAAQAMYAAGGGSADHPRKSCREHEREREDHDALTKHEAKKLERMRRLVTTHGLDGDELDHGRGEAVRDDDRDQADPLPEDVFGARDRPRENR